MVAQQHDDGDEEGDPERRPDQLCRRRPVARGLQVETVDQHQAQSVEQDGDGQQQRIGERGAEADREVGEQGEDTETGAVPGDVGGTAPFRARPTAA